MTKHLIAFNATELLSVTAEINNLVKSLQGRKLEEGDWTSIYCRVKGAPDPGWSNLPFRDYIHEGVGIEFKLLSKSDPSSYIGRSLMHPAATRTISFEETDSPDVAMKKVFAQWGAAIDSFESRVAATSPTGVADIRWGILLWDPEHTEFLYFEEKLEKPDPSDFTAVWHEGKHRNKPTRNLHIFENSSGLKRFSCTLPRNGAKLQPYFDIPDIADGAHIFTPVKRDSVPLFANRVDADLIQQLFPDFETEDAIAKLVKHWQASDH